MGCNLRDLAPSQPIDLNELKGEKVAVDVFLNAYQFITSLTGQDGKPLSYNGKPVAHLMGFLDRATIMIEEGIDPVFVFDGKPHQLKMETLGTRKERKINAVSKWEAAIESGDLAAAKKLGPQTAEYTREMVAETKELFDCLGVTWLEAPMEAEGAAAVRCKNGEVAAVASQDWDVLLYGSPVMIRNLMAHGTKKFGRKVTAERIVLSELLEEHEITQEQLVDLGIMIGTDFHPGIKGIGPKTGLKLIKKHGTMEAICLEKDVDLPGNLAQIRAIFHEHPIHQDVLPTAGMADEKKLREFLQEERGFSENRMTRALNRLKSVGKLRNAGQSSLFDF